VDHIRRTSRGFKIVIVEGAGGLLSPMTDRNDGRDLIAALRASVIVVVPNRLGAVNQARLVLDALPATAVRRTVVVLTAPPVNDLATRTNAALFGTFFSRERISELPRLGEPFPKRIPLRLRKLLRHLLEPIVPA